ncbi:MAG: hypothetical protein K2X00_16955 [Nitrospiraceae bacterium]|nr:hypothetical protein [Nitrospiraceae bacterium]OQW64177.1 MAG: hypothetical protein BVN29_13870 [Nitrospira sp. ST-bin5]
MANRIIELHDSTIERIATDLEGKIRVVFSSAYIHVSDGTPGIDKGSGFVQRAELQVEQGIISGSLPPFPSDISDGSMVLDGIRRDNTIPIPFEFLGSFNLLLVFVPGDSMSVQGIGARLSLQGNPRYIEEFPGR